MTKFLVFERCRFSFNLFIDLMIQSFNIASLFSKQHRSSFSPVVFRVLLAFLLIKVRIKRLGSIASSYQGSTASTNKKFIFEMLFLYILCWVLRFYPVSLKLILCQLNWVDFKKMLYFGRFLVFYFESFFCCLVLRKMFYHFVNCMHCFSCNQLNRGSRTQKLSRRL